MLGGVDSRSGMLPSHVCLIPRIVPIAVKSKLIEVSGNTAQRNGVDVTGLDSGVLSIGLGDHCTVHSR